MAARRRDPARRGWPENVYEDGGYYSYRNPLDGKHYGIGRDRAAAFARARAANTYIAQQRAHNDLVDRITGEASRTLADWIDRHDEILEQMAQKGERATLTRRQDKHFAKVIKAWDKARHPVSRITTLDLAEFIQTWTDAGKYRMALALRSFFVILFRRAIAAGWCATSPADVLESISVKVKRARLTLQTFRAIHEAAGELDPWVQRSMELALVSGQRREDIGVVEFKARAGARAWIADDRLWVIQHKSKNRVCIPLALRLDVLGWTVGSVTRRCRDRVVSNHLVHHSRNYGNAPAGSAVHIDTISRGFHAARQKSGLTWPERDEDGNLQTPPTFHEIRSLAARLYGDQGIDPQALLGHRDPKSTALYRDSRGTEWIEVAV